MGRIITLTILIVALACQALPQGRLEAPSSEKKQEKKSVVSKQQQLFDDKRKEQDKKAEIEMLLQRYITDDCDKARNLMKCTTPGAAVMVVKQDKPVYERYIGSANIHNTPIDRNTRFDLASVSKQFTAMAIVMLRAQGKLEFDDTLDKFFDGTFDGITFKPGIANKVKIRHLLNHTSGLKDVSTLYFEGPGKHAACKEIHNHWPRSARALKEFGDEPTARDALRCIASQEESEQSFAPGAPGRWEYNNGGYIILAQIVERLTGERFAEFMRKNVFEPLKMDHTLVMDETTTLPLPNRAISYDRGWDEFHDIDYTPLNKMYGDGNVNATLEDLSKWDRALNVIFNKSAYPGETPLVERRFVDEALDTKDQTTTHPRIKYSSGWFFGFYRDENGRMSNLMWHAGRWAGFETMILRFFGSSPSEHLTVIVLANNRLFPPSVIACKIAKIYLRDPTLVMDQSPLTEQQLQEVVTNYHKGVDEADKEDITLEDGELFAKDRGLEKYRLVRHAMESRRESQNATRTAGESKNVVVLYFEGLEGFDTFRYDITSTGIFTPPQALEKEIAPSRQRN